MYHGQSPHVQLRRSPVTAAAQVSGRAQRWGWSDHLPPRCGSHRVQVACSDRGPRRVRGDGSFRPVAQGAASPLRGDQPHAVGCLTRRR